MDREKVISGLKCHVNLKCHNCPYVDAIHPAYGCHLEELIADALALLKEQEPIPCGEKIKAGDVVLDFYECGYCKNAIRKPWRYCSFCGKAVKWE